MMLGLNESVNESVEVIVDNVTLLLPDWIKSVYVWRLTPLSALFLGLFFITIFMTAGFWYRRYRKSKGIKGSSFKELFDKIKEGEA